ncbi:hypothetical protein DFH09DRAFT_1275397 [Mycena vulgaris]|nr:hypothetical protein DFH09DRAFT_1275397 [Mycena vulgaris]
MVHYKFADALELHALLQNVFGLKDLALRYIEFSNNNIKYAPRTPIVVLDSLALLALESAEVSSMLQAFIPVDITRLRPVDLTYTAMHMMDLFRANASRLQQLEGIPQSSESVDADILANALQLAAIGLRVRGSSMMHDVLRLFGTLARLTALRRLTLRIFYNIYTTDVPIWRSVDADLSSLQLDSVEVNAPK